MNSYKNVLQPCSFCSHFLTWHNKFLPVVWFREGQQGSVLSFGDVDSSLYQGQIYWTPVTAETYWQIGIEGSVLFNISLIQSIN